MTEYSVTITRSVPNPDFKERRGSFGGYANDEPQRYKEQTVTSCTLTEEQWRKVQRAIVEAME